MKVRVLLLAVVAALAFSATSQAASRNVVVDVLITDKGLVLGLYLNTPVADITTMTPIMGTVSRQDDLHFVVFNRGKKAHNFSIFGKATSTIKPGGSAKFEQRAPGRGKFPYGSTLDSAAAFHGTLTVH
jgi:hypothetical protein